MLLAADVDHGTSSSRFSDILCAAVGRGNIPTLNLLLERGITWRFHAVRSALHQGKPDEALLILKYEGPALSLARSQCLAGINLCFEGAKEIDHGGHASKSGHFTFLKPLKDTAPASMDWENADLVIEHLAKRKTGPLRTVDIRNAMHETAYFGLPRSMRYFLKVGEYLSDSLQLLACAAYGANHDMGQTTDVISALINKWPKRKFRDEQEYWRWLNAAEADESAFRLFLEHFGPPPEIDNILKGPFELFKDFPAARKVSAWGLCVSHRCH